MSGYHKLTKYEVDFPRYCLFFIKKIQEEIDNEGFNEDNELVINIDSTFRYCSDAFDLITKTFERKGLIVNIPTYRLTIEDDVKHYIYKWKFEKYPSVIPIYDDLPF
jgi:hypothetical protein